MNESIERTSERIVGVALWDSEHDKIYSLALSSETDHHTHEHSNILKKLQIEKIDYSAFIEGFITSYGTFVNRHDAIEIAKKSRPNS